MHIGGHGDAARLAAAIHDAIDLAKTPAAAPASNPNADLGFDAKQLDNLIGRAGKNNNGVYQFAVPRAEKIMENGMAVPNSMGVATALNFQPTGGGKAAKIGRASCRERGEMSGVAG